MQTKTETTRPNFDSVKELILEVAQEEQMEVLLRNLVERLAQRDHVALARIWVLRQGDICTRCHLRTVCPDRSLCLHLLASAGQSINAAKDRWDRIDGSFTRVPLGLHTIGRIAKTGKTLVVKDFERLGDRLVDLEWIEKENIRLFMGVPLLHKNQVVGVFAMFGRRKFSDEHIEEALIWQRMIADLITSAVAKHRAFEELHLLNKHLILEKEYLLDDVRPIHGTKDFIGTSGGAKELFHLIDLVAPVDATVLIQGESGTGKELIAQMIHDKSERKDKPLIKVNCASIPRELFESEFFGHVKGSFTGAIRDRLGRFELADGGTIFLDEVGEIPLELQSKLLRVIQEGEFQRIGEEKTRSVDVRIIAATNLDLKKAVAEKIFRKDLYFRLSVFPIKVLPLRERVDDVGLLAKHFITKFCQHLKKPPIPLKRKHVLQMQRYQWPGNIRELQNVIERAVIISAAGELHLDLPEEALEMNDRPSSDGVLTYPELKQLERNNLLAALEETDWKITGPQGAAQLLDINPSTLTSRIKAMALHP